MSVSANVVTEARQGIFLGRFFEIQYSFLDLASVNQKIIYGHLANFHNRLLCLVICLWSKVKVFHMQDANVTKNGSDWDIQESARKLFLLEILPEYKYCEFLLSLMLHLWGDLDGPSHSITLLSVIWGWLKSPWAHNALFWAQHHRDKRPGWTRQGKPPDGLEILDDPGRGQQLEARGQQTATHAVTSQWKLHLGTCIGQRQSLRQATAHPEPLWSSRPPRGAGLAASEIPAKIPANRLQRQSPGGRSRPPTGRIDCHFCKSTKFYKSAKLIN